MRLSPLRPGQTMGAYALVAPPGSGGMANVWLARRAGDDDGARFALKTIQDTHATDPRFESMFLREVRVASRLRHPNVVRVIDGA